METDASTKRILIETNVIDGNVAETFTFSQAETLHLDFVAYTANQKRIKMPEGGSCKMEAWIDGTPATLYVQKTGTVNTTTRKATVTLSRAESNMPVGDYLFTVKVFDSDDLLTGIIARGTMTALYSPQTDSVDYVGTSPAIDPDLDFALYDSYSNTATHGPVRPGTGITNVVNADGSNTHSVTYGSTASTAAEGNDTRLSDARTPTAHASTHATGGSDPVTAADVDVAGTAIAAALLAKAADNDVVKLNPTGTQTISVGSGEAFGNVLVKQGRGTFDRLVALDDATLGQSEAVFQFDRQRIGDGSPVPKWQTGLRRDAQSPENDAYTILNQLSATVRFWISNVDGMVRTVVGTVTAILKASSTTGLVFQNSAGTEKLKVGAATGADVQVTGTFSVSALPTYADEAAAVTGGLATGDIYKTATGELRVKL